MSDNAQPDGPSPTPIFVKQNGSSRSKEIGIGVGVPMFFIIVGLVIFTLWFRRRRRTVSVREMVGDQEKKAGRENDGSESDVDSVRDMKELEKRRPGTGYGEPRRSNSARRGGEPYTRPATSPGLSYAERFNGISPPKRDEVSLVERLIRSRSQNDHTTNRLHKARPSVDLLQRPRTTAISTSMRARTNIVRPSSVVTRTTTIKQTRFDVPPSPATSHHKRSISEPLQSLMRPKTAPTLSTTTTKQQQQQQQQQSPPWTPPQMDLSQRPFTPVSIMPESSFSRPTKGSYALPAAFISTREMAWRPQSPGYEVHTELWRQQQQQWILEERRQIKQEYERLMKQRETEEELRRMAASREERRAVIQGLERRRQSPLLVRREMADEEMDRELGLSGLRRGYGH